MTYYLVVDAGITKKPECCCECPLITSDEDCVSYWCVVTQEICKNTSKRNRYCPIKGFVKKANIIKEVTSKESKE